MNPYFPTHESDSFAGVCTSPLLQALAARAPNGALAALAGQAGMTQQGLYNSAQLAEAAKVEIRRGDDVMYGIDSGAANIAAGVTATLTVTPQKRHVPQRIVLSQNVANNFVVTDIRSGVEPVLITVGAISAAVFIQDATCPPFRSVVMEVGMDFSITVTNITGAAQRFTATVLGKYLPYGI